MKSHTVEVTGRNGTKFSLRIQAVGTFHAMDKAWHIYGMPKSRGDSLSKTQVFQDDTLRVYRNVD